MSKIIVKFLAVLAVLVSSVAFAQCVPMNGPYTNRYGFVENMPRIYDGARGCYVPQGTSQLPQQTGYAVSNNGNNYNPFANIFSQYGTNGQMVQYGGQQMYAPQGVQQGQPFMAVNQNGQRMMFPASCTMMDRAASAAVDGIGMGLLVGVVSKLAGSKHSGENARLGAAVGVLYGATAGCDPQIVNDGQDQQQVAYNQNNGYQQQQQQTMNCSNRPGTRLGTLNQMGHQMNGQKVCAPPGDPNVIFDY